MNNLDDRITAALHAAVDGVREQDLRPADPPVAGAARAAGARRPIRWAAPLLAAAAVVAAAAVTVALTSTSTSPQYTPPGGTGPSAPSTPGPTLIDPDPPQVLGGELPLWPFATLEEADHWKNVEAAQGHSPWHADAEATALFFVRGYLQFRDIDTVTSSDIRGAQADIGVGYDTPNEGGTHTASVIHLVKFGDDSGPWEVVGATAADLSITTVAQSADPSVPMTVGGRITGVDESVAVSVLALDGETDQGDEPVPAGGENTPWTTTVRLSSEVRGALTIAASTGGHLTAHERFAVVGATRKT